MRLLSAMCDKESTQLCLFADVSIRVHAHITVDVKNFVLYYNHLSLTRCGAAKVPLVVILGATGAGKSRLALELAQVISRECIPPWLCRKSVSNKTIRKACRRIIMVVSDRC
jgi:hypothetical protein